MKKKSQHLVSIIIPTYNSASLLINAVESVRNQTYDNWEAIIVDNHSKDNTREIISKFNEPRIRFYKIKNNGIIAMSRNLGIARAKGDWIAFLDADDIWYKTRLEKLIKKINSEEKFDVIVNNELIVNCNNNTTKIIRYGPYEKNFYKTLLIKGNRVSTSATLVNSKFIISKNLYFDESKKFISVEDYDYWLKLALFGAKFKFINDILGEYYIHDKNVSNNINFHWKNCENLLKKHVHEIQKFESNHFKLWKIISTRIKISKALTHFRINNYYKCIQLIIGCLIKDPTNTIQIVFFKILRIINLSKDN